MRKIFITSFLILLSVVMVSGSAYALSGVCSNCHTMHYSQDGVVPSDWGQAGPYPTLLYADCVGCHSGALGAVNTHDAPIVRHTTDPGGQGPGKTLAGGSFYYIASGGNRVHNTTGMAEDETLSTPPGYDGGRLDSQGNRPGGGTWSGQVACAGTNGCHGTHNTTVEMDAIKGSHHSNAAGSLTTASTVSNSYRFLIGIHGYEDTDFEYTASDGSADHNQYKGAARSGDTADNSTISWLCGECHGKFHSNAADVGTASPWLRHPTDFSLGDATGTEYSAYNNSGPGTVNYSIVAPVGSIDVSVQIANPVISSDQAIVTCISCHRAHGSPYSDLLRWDYETIRAGIGGPNNNTGCFICHTTKDGL